MVGKFVRRDPRVPWFKSPRGTTIVAGYKHLAICAQCKRLFNNFDARQDKRGRVLCYWCYNGVEFCKVCGSMHNYGSLDYTHICENCRNTGRDLRWQDEHKEIRVLQYHK